MPNWGHAGCLKSGLTGSPAGKYAKLGPRGLFKERSNRLRATPLLRVKVKITVKVPECSKPKTHGHTVFLTVNLTLTHKSGVALTGRQGYLNVCETRGGQSNRLTGRQVYLNVSETRGG